MGADSQIISFSHVVAFDGVCNFCNFWVNFLIGRDRKALIHFVSLQDLIAAGKLNSDPDKLDSIIYFTNDKSFTKADAVLEIVKILGFPFSLLLMLKIIPKVLRNGIYDFVARNRYRWFGRKDVCRIPTVEERSRFIDSSLLPNFVAESKIN